jgi:hypothetical protein
LVYEPTEAYPHDTKHFLAFFKWTKEYNRIEYNLKILPVTRLKDPSGDFDTENAYRNDCNFLKSYRKPPVTNEVLLIFPAANERSAPENNDQSQRREF